MIKKLKNVSEEEKDKEVKNELEIEEKIDEELQALLDSYSPDDFRLGKGNYRLIKNHREGFDYEATIKRYNDILEKYDFIVGDWGYDQLRLKGFFMDDFKSAPMDSKIGTLEDYLYEYCNFGCAYFVIQQIGDFKRKGRTTTSQKKATNKTAKKEKKYDKNSKKVQPNKNKRPKNQTSKKNISPSKKNGNEKKFSSNNTKHQFTIRKKEKE